MQQNNTMNKHQILKQYFGYDQFRQGQEYLIDSTMEGRDTLGIMPTGAGKSLCFQIPSLMMDGITLVISPLISLMKDQVGALNQAGIHAAYLNSSLTASQYYKALEYARDGRYPIIYVAPERLMTDEFLNFALHTTISMIAVDEAHCVSQWGQDFRPSYLKILDFVKQLPVRPAICAYTATATKEVRDDIIDILMLENPAVLTTGFDRPNLYFSVQSPKNKYATMKNYLELHRQESGIIYCLTRKHVEEVCQKLKQDGFLVTRYHAGLSDNERRQNQEDFIYDKYPLMVATNAFGMGIDKSNVRFVVHYSMPKNMESYYQEAGRSGRDGEPAECILLYGGQDVITNQLFIDRNLEHDELDSEARELVMERDRERLRKMTFYCFTNECLRDYILRYFGEYGSNYCGNCSNCLSQFETVDVTDIAKGLIGCIYACRQRYGVNVIIDTVHGANTAKIRQYRMDENSYYGTLAQIPAFKLRQVINHLLLNEYLLLTNDEYAIVKLLEKSRLVLEEEEAVVMKMAKEQEREPKEKKEKNRKGKSAGVLELSEVEGLLFEKLRTLRTEIAREEKVPPYIVFSDKSLTHMCVVKPGSKAEMMTVTGVGEFKYEKYGERFLECVTSELMDFDRSYENEALYFSSDEDEWTLETTLPAGENESWERNTELDKIVVKKRSPKNAKTDFVMTDKLVEQIHYSEKITLSDFVGQINDLRDDDVMKRLTIKSVEQKLLDEGIIELRFVNRVPLKSLTEQGMEFGIVVEPRVSEKGNDYEVLYYTEIAQRRMVEWLLKDSLSE